MVVANSALLSERLRRASMHSADPTVSSAFGKFAHEAWELESRLANAESASSSNAKMMAEAIADDLYQRGNLMRTAQSGAIIPADRWPMSATRASAVGDIEAILAPPASRLAEAEALLREVAEFGGVDHQRWCEQLRLDTDGVRRARPCSCGRDDLDRDVAAFLAGGAGNS